MTNREFLEFVKARGYQRRELWTEEGELAKKKVSNTPSEHNFFSPTKVGSGWSSVRPVTLPSGCAGKGASLGVGQTLPLIRTAAPTPPPAPALPPLAPGRTAPAMEQAGRPSSSESLVRVQGGQCLYGRP